MTLAIVSRTVCAWSRHGRLPFTASGTKPRPPAYAGASAAPPLRSRRESQRHERVRRYLYQAGIPQQPRQATREVQISAPLSEERANTRPDLVRQLLLEPHDVDARQRLHGWVEVLDEEPSPGTECPRHALQGHFSLGNVDEDESGVDEIEDALWRVVRGDIVLTNLDIPAGKLLGPGHVDVRREHVTRWTHSRRQPLRNRGPTDANFPAAPPGSDAERVEVPEGHGIEQCGEAVEALPGLGRAVVEQVAAVSGGQRWLGHRAHASSSTGNLPRRRGAAIPNLDSDAPAPECAT